MQEYVGNMGHGGNERGQRAICGKPNLTFFTFCQIQQEYLGTMGHDWNERAQRAIGGRINSSFLQLESQPTAGPLL